ncbi:Holliday junction resolvase RuvX [Arthrobacter sp. 35W]|uniref:Holliday junction resolvase RuvX n=1 Tax=Arthrobacter sp. 35W TaxID=1132441 RepID=UPI00041D016D|nr:Holliday junction resolvase RuvX [Arthrobacter sp. 35W]
MAYPKGPKLGVDVGTVRVGLAACDPDSILATPVRTVGRDVKKNSDIAIVLREARERAVVEIFVGLPRTLKGAEKASAEMARTYANLLVGALAAAEMAVPVRLVDERLSTVSAHQALHAAGMDSRDHRKVVDQVAAAGILQHAIDMEKSRGTTVGTLVPAPTTVALGSTGAPDRGKDDQISPVASPGTVL